MSSLPWDLTSKNCVVTDFLAILFFLNEQMKWPHIISIHKHKFLINFIITFVLKDISHVFGSRDLKKFNLNIISLLNEKNKKDMHMVTDFFFFKWTNEMTALHFYS